MQRVRDGKKAFQIPDTPNEGVFTEAMRKVNWATFIVEHLPYSTWFIYIKPLIVTTTQKRRQYHPDFVEEKTETNYLMNFYKVTQIRFFKRVSTLKTISFRSHHYMPAYCLRGWTNLKYIKNQWCSWSIVSKR